jgi:uncharacterized protein YbjT (DUF2867 family)
MNEADYMRITHDIAVAAAETLARLNPQMTFLFISGAGADGTEPGPVMWARVKGKTENALRRLPFKAVYVLSPGIIQPLDGIRSKTAAYRVFYAIASPFLPIARRLFPDYVVPPNKSAASC